MCPLRAFGRNGIDFDSGPSFLLVWFHVNNKHVSGQAPVSWMGSAWMLNKLGTVLYVHLGPLGAIIYAVIFVLFVAICEAISQKGYNCQFLKS